MRTIYRNVTVLDKDLHTEVLKVHFSKVNTVQRKMYFVATVVCGLALAVGLFRRMWIPVLISGVSLIVSAFLATNSYRFTVKNQHAQLLKYEPTARREYVFGPDRFEGIVPTGKMAFRYEDIARVIEADRFFLLVFEDMGEHAIEKAGFSKGEAKDFKQFVEGCMEAARRGDKEEALDEAEDSFEEEQELRQEDAAALEPEPTEENRSEEHSASEKESPKE